MSDDTAFVGGIPEVYEHLLVPMIFARPADRLAALVAARRPGPVLETAAGTGVLTRALAARGLEVTATDLNAAMLDAARHRQAGGTVRWQVADALDLPYDDGAFGAVVCQFGVMFFPDRAAGHREAARVLRPDGLLAFSVWDRIGLSPVAEVVTDAVCAVAPEQSLDFLRRTPHGYHDPAVIEHDLASAGFRDVVMERLTGSSATTAEEAAAAYCRGTPLRGHLEASSLGLEEATRIAREALVDRFGNGKFDAPFGWFQVTARRG